MAQRVELSAENREELAYRLICWMEKRGLWEYTPLFSRETCYSSGIISELARLVGLGGCMDGAPLKGVH